MNENEQLILFDMRCLQDSAYKHRGVGKLSENLVRSVDRLSKKYKISTLGLVDPALPPLEDSFRNLVDEVCANAHVGLERGPTVFIELSPMTHDPLFVARVVNDTDVLKIAIVYDFIPLLKPERYLPNPSNRIHYDTQLTWLSRFDHFFPISQYTADELHRILHIDSTRITNTAAPVGSAFELLRSSALRERLPKRYVLAPGGAEPRKNIECPIKAHARSGALQDAQIGLVVAGNYPWDWQARLRDLYVSCGGQSDLLFFTGFIDEDDLVAIYRGATCAIVAAHMEGFSIPVVEAMAAGTPVVASDIPAHVELVERGDLMFSPDDAQEAMSKLEMLVSNESHRAAVIEDQSTRWQRFRADNIASMFWNAVDGLLVTRKPGTVFNVTRGSRPRIAFLSPMPPDRSGVADYSAATIKELGKLVDVDVYARGKLLEIPEGASTANTISPFPFVSPQYDRVIGVVGNSDFHLEIFNLLMRYGGACIEHDNRLLGFYRILHGLGRTQDVAQMELKRAVSCHEIDSWMSDESLLEATFLGELAKSCSPLFLHSKVTTALVNERLNAGAIHLPFSIYRPWTYDPVDLTIKNNARKRLGMEDGEFAIATFGYIHSNKAIEEIIWAVDLLRSWNVPAKLYCVGGWATLEHQLFLDLRSRLGLEDHIVFAAEYTSDAKYRDFLLAADAGVQLRTHFLGGLSGGLLDCIAAGLPTVANDDMAEAMDAPSYILRVPDHPSPVLIAEALAEISDRIRDRTKLGGERLLYSDEHSFKRYSELLCQYLGFDLKVPWRSRMKEVAA
ncbi:glycosyltransferase involved in cell wall biosynthesis [Phyllobacterium trifolii]|uniref:Glycosyltransferase involved in cell wall biosynthesis n=1 Tax=Phyllobacterium trifolii TaxID=300193 RepID=A0A839U4F2_9HYPH|nr:glycosyltransferase [Phyllobacterium trifolii]MBB3143621.1 glycosyltransferase involved in cell wall biosynthesis [Phyllobacterium trifolii]